VALAFLSGLTSFIVFRIIDLPYSLALAAFVGFISQFIPVIGTYLAGAFPIIIALVNDPVKALWVAAFIVIYQQVENYLLAPRITARTMSLHPAIAFAAVLGGSAILGPVGTLLALPAAASIQAFSSTYVRRHEVIDSPLLESYERPSRRAKRDTEHDTESES
jgi:predicted PurR-regulated permease PerM